MREQIVRRIRAMKARAVLATDFDCDVRFERDALYARQSRASETEWGIAEGHVHASVPVEIDCCLFYVYRMQRWAEMLHSGEYIWHRHIIYMVSADYEGAVRSIVLNAALEGVPGVFNGMEFWDADDPRYRGVA